MKKKMHNACILIIGTSLFEDDEFITSLEEIFTIIKGMNLRQIHESIRKSNVNVIIFEPDGTDSFDLEVIKVLNSNYPDIPIIFLNSEREQIIKAFEYGIKDFFRVPYKRELLVERIQVLSSINENEVEKSIL